MIDDKVLLPIDPDRFTDKDLSVIRVIEKFNSVNVEYAILKLYASHASALAELEGEVIKSLCEKRDEKNFSTLWQITFELLLSVKPYIFNRHTHEIFKNKLKEEIDSGH